MRSMYRQRFPHHFFLDRYFVPLYERKGECGKGGFGECSCCDNDFVKGIGLGGGGGGGLELLGVGLVGDGPEMRFVFGITSDGSDIGEMMESGP